MTLKTVRVCEQCDRETPEKEPFYVVRLYSQDPSLPQPLSAVTREVCSLYCVSKATEDWIVLRGGIQR